MSDTQHELYSIVNIHGLYGLIVHIRHDETYLVRFGDGSEAYYDDDDITSATENENFIDSLIALYMLQQFKRAQANDISGSFKATITASAGMSANELKIEHEAELGSWSGPSGSFKSRSTELSVRKAIDRLNENRMHEVKLLSAS